MTLPVVSLSNDELARLQQSPLPFHRLRASRQWLFAWKPSKHLDFAIGELREMD